MKRFKDARSALVALVLAFGAQFQSAARGQVFEDADRRGADQRGVDPKNGGAIAPGTRPVASPPGHPPKPSPTTDGAGAAGDRAAVDTRLPIPAAADVARADVLLREHLKGLAAKRTPQEQKVLADLLLKQAEEAAGRPADQYAMLQEARRQAAANGNVAAAVRVAAAVGDTFAVDGDAELADALTAVSPKVREQAEGEQLLDAWSEAMDAAAASGKMDVAVRAAAGAEAAVRWTKDRELAADVRARARLVREARDVEAGAAAARATLAKSPDDPAANLAVGRHLCFIRGDWAAGAPFLAKGTPDKVLKDLLARDAGAPTDVGGRLSLADAWAAYAMRQAGLAGKASRSRGAYWYRAVIADGAGGLERLTAERKLKELEGQSVYQAIASAVKAGAVDKSPLLGKGEGKEATSLPAQGGILIGFVASPGELWSNPMVKGVRPIYRTADGRFEGEPLMSGRNRTGDDVVLEARRGYAVGAMVVKASDTVYGFKLIYMRVRGDRGLDPNDRYESAWFGGKGGQAERTVGGDGRYVVGLHTIQGFEGFSLIQVKGSGKP